MPRAATAHTVLIFLWTASQMTSAAPAIRKAERKASWRNNPFRSATSAGSSSPGSEASEGPCKRTRQGKEAQGKNKT